MNKIGELMNLSKICKTCNLEKCETALANKNRNLNKGKNFFKPVLTLEKKFLNLTRFFSDCFFLLTVTVLLFVKCNFRFVLL